MIEREKEGETERRREGYIDRAETRGERRATKGGWS